MRVSTALHAACAASSLPHRSTRPAAAAPGDGVGGAQLDGGGGRLGHRDARQLGLHPGRRELAAALRGAVGVQAHGGGQAQRLAARRLRLRLVLGLGRLLRLGRLGLLLLLRVSEQQAHEAPGGGLGHRQVRGGGRRLLQRVQGDGAGRQLQRLGEVSQEGVQGGLLQGWSTGGREAIGGRSDAVSGGRAGCVGRE